jgi:hypothetical protein
LLRFPGGQSRNDVTNLRKDWIFISIAATAILGIACVSTDALARGGRAGHAGGVHHGGVAHGAYVRRGVAVGVGAAAVGATRYYNSNACGYYPYPPCY